jgi:hypothetical protein
MIHVLDEGNALCWDFMFLQGSPHEILRYLIADFLQVNEHHMHHMQVLLLLLVSLNKFVIPRKWLPWLTS